MAGEFVPLDLCRAPLGYMDVVCARPAGHKRGGCIGPFYLPVDPPTSEHESHDQPVDECWDCPPSSF